MEVISIGTVPEALFPLKEKLGHEISRLQAEGLPVDLTEKQRGELYFLGCSIDDPLQTPVKNPCEMVRLAAAQVLSSMVLEDMPQFILSRLLHRLYNHFDPQEQESIVQRACILLPEMGLQDQGNSDSLKEITRLQILDYLHGHRELVVDGFVRFRMKEYVQYLSGVLEKAVDGFLLDREYQEFIRLLRYFVDLQQPLLEEVHVVVRPSGLFRLLDPDRRIISNEYLEGEVTQLAEGALDYEDLLISALITIAPRKIILHFRDHPRAVDTLRNVFQGRVLICEGCTLCQAVKPTVDRDWGLE